MGFFGVCPQVSLGVWGLGCSVSSRVCLESTTNLELSQFRATFVGWVWAVNSGL